MRMNIAKRIYEYRKAAGLSQEELAQRINVSRQAVSKWECGESSPDTENLIALAMLYGVTVDELLFADPECRDGESVTEAPFVDGLPTPEAYGNPDGESGASEGEAWSAPADPAEDYVNISLENGVHVRDSRKGEEVHVSWDGIHIDNDKEHVHLDFGMLARMIREFRKDQN